MVETVSHDLLLVDDEAGFRNAAAKHFRHHGYRVAEAGDGEHALRLAKGRRFNVAAVDMFMPNGVSGIELLKQIKWESDCQLVVLAGGSTIDTAVAAMKLGAYDFLPKPVPIHELAAVVERACEVQPFQAPQRVLKRPADMIGDSTPMRELYRLLARAGPSDRPILIQGETGTGKELVARSLHRASPRQDKPFVAINCAAISGTLLESELFGHEKGAFTDAITAKEGLFEAADGGTLLIDEMGEMPLKLQAKLLRVLEDGSLRRVGAVTDRHVDVRILAASNRVLADEVRARRFREDLYYRLCADRIQTPGLREQLDDCPEDLHALCIYIARRLAGDDGDSLAEQTIGWIQQNLDEGYPWSGNIRELEQCVGSVMIRNEYIPSDASRQSESDAGPRWMSELRRGTLTVDELLQHYCSWVYDKTGSYEASARQLGIDRRTVKSKIEQLNESQEMSC